MIVGIDEAGRGPVLGPMVYTALFTTYEKEVKKLHFQDSKQLTAEKREELYGTIKQTPYIGYATAVLTPNEISKKMCSPAKISLNQIAYDCVNDLLALIKKVTNKTISKVYADTVGPSAKYAASIKTGDPTLKTVIVEAKADAKYAVVSGASIVAKVTRDNCITNWIFEEGECTHNLGSGYPGGL